VRTSCRRSSSLHATPIDLSNIVRSRLDRFARVTWPGDGRDSTVQIQRGVSPGEYDSSFMALTVSTSASFQQTTLDNGLRVILREVRERPLVGVWMWYRVGGRNELPGTTGVSHWVEHMLFKGGKRFGKGEITKEISRRGGALNAFTWIDCTSYFETLPSTELDVALAIESDRVYDTRIEPDEAEAERTVVISEREGSENYPEFW